MDDPVESLAELEASLADLERANRYLGGVTPLREMIFSRGATSVLDVGCGSADIPLAVASAAQAQGRKISITCTDVSEQMLDIARRRTREHPALRFERADGTALPYADSSFDVVTCDLALHHFAPDHAVSLLGEMRRVARITPIVCDLRRGFLAWLGVWFLAQVATRNRLTRNDGPLSVRRAYTPDEALALARRAGWSKPCVRKTPFFRMLLCDA